MVSHRIIFGLYTLMRKMHSLLSVSLSLFYSQSWLVLNFRAELTALIRYLLSSRRWQAGRRVLPQSGLQAQSARWSLQVYCSRYWSFSWSPHVTLQPQPPGSLHTGTLAPHSNTTCQHVNMLTCHTTSHHSHLTSIVLVTVTITGTCEKIPRDLFIILNRGIIRH